MKSKEMPKSSGGRPIRTASLRWTLTRAAIEFAISLDTIAKRVRLKNLQPDADGMFGTKAIATAIYGDLELERIGLTAAERKAQERENRIADDQLVDIEDFTKDYAPIYLEMLRQIKGSSLTDAEKRSLLNTMSQLHETDARNRKA